MLSRKDIFYRNMLTIVKSYHRVCASTLNIYLTISHLIIRPDSCSVVHGQ